jgi:hypothetical protein
MGIFDLFGGHPTDDGEDSKNASARNEAEEQARDDYNQEVAETDQNPIPTEVPDWAADLPSPGGKE